MSFDTEFDYTVTKNNLAAKIAEVDSQIAEYDSKITLLESIPVEYDPQRNRKVDRLNSLRTLSAEIKADLEEIELDIPNIENLSAGDKQVLYDFHVATESDRLNFMMILVLNDRSSFVTDISNFNSDDRLTEGMKDSVCELICTKYSPKISVLRNRAVFS